jgi:glutamate-1-semialdehyde 2,1-aminomutase
MTLAAIRAVLEHVMTHEAYSHMIGLAKELEKGVDKIIRNLQLPWHVTRIGARAEYMFRPAPPLNGT